MVKISVIIPVYNCEEYLEQCLESVGKQTMQELEILCIDDGSRDLSPDILREYACKDSRVRIYTQENGGAGRARNLGLMHGRGEYVVFLDGDDYYLDADALEVMYHMCREKQVRVCGSLRKRIVSGTEQEDAVFPWEKMQPLPGRVCRYQEYQSDYNYQSFLFQRSLLTDNGIFFPEYRRYQDPPFFVRAMDAAGEFCMADKYLYCYRMPAMAVRFDAEKAQDLLKGLADNLSFASAQGLDRLFQNTLHRINYDFADVIYRNITIEGTGMLEVLLRANRLARDKLENSSYLLRPLRRLLAGVEEDVLEYEERLLRKINCSDRVYLYGAGKLSTLFLEYLEEATLKDRIKGVVVSRSEGNGAELLGIPVRSLEDFEIGDGALLFVAVRVHFQEEIVTALDKRHVENYELLDTEFLDRLERRSGMDTGK